MECSKLLEASYISPSACIVCREYYKEQTNPGAFAGQYWITQSVKGIYHFVLSLRTTAGVSVTLDQTVAHRQTRSATTRVCCGVVECVCLCARCLMIQALLNQITTWAGSNRAWCIYWLDCYITGNTTDLRMKLFHPCTRTQIYMGIVPITQHSVSSIEYIHIYTCVCMYTMYDDNLCM